MISAWWLVVLLPLSSVGFLSICIWLAVSIKENKPTDSVAYTVLWSDEEKCWNATIEDMYYEYRENYRKEEAKRQAKQDAYNLGLREYTASGREK